MNAYCNSLPLEATVKSAYVCALGSAGDSSAKSAYVCAFALEGVEVTEHTGTENILTGNTDIAVSQRGTFSTDTRHCTLPIYPLQRDLPQLRRNGGAA